MKLFGLTGGVGSGKSRVASLLRARGIPLVDADELARRLTAKGSPVLAELENEFGGAILDAKRELIRSALASIVFGSDERRAKLNAILHPRISALARREFRALEENGHALAGYEVPLLFETNQEGVYRPVVVVSSTEETQVRRAMARSGWSESEARARIASQIPLAEKAKRADFVVENDGSLEELEANVEKLVAFLRS